VSAQQTAGPSFEVASVKLAEDGGGLPAFITGMPEMSMRFRGSPGTKSPERINYLGVTFKMLIQQAYGVRPEQVVGPDWIANQRYTITATLPPETTLEQSRLMLQNLLSERFQLRLHRETRLFRVYHLAVAKNGPKLTQTEKPIKDEQEQIRALQNNAAKARARLASEGITRSFEVYNRPVSEFLDKLSLYLDYPVIDRTELKGRYTFQLSWYDWANPREGAPQGPSIFAALREQLGMELKPGSDHIEVLAIDAAERMPSGN
jgi:uncharacterized protein (TIGR03435 family)